MDVDQVQAFVSIAQLGGFTRAARSLYRSQPAISRRVSLLEGELGAPLFDRVGGALRLTDVGRAFLPHAESMLASLRDGKEAARGTQRAERPVLALALVGTLLDTPLVERLRAFSQADRAVALSIRTAASQEVSQLVRRGEATVGIRYYLDSSPSLSCRQIAAETMRLVVSASHPFATRPPKDLGLLAKQRWIGFAPVRRQPESFGNILRERLGRVGLAHVEVMAVDSLSAQKRLVEADFGITLLPESSVREELRRGSLRTVSLRALEHTLPICAVYRQKGYLSPAAHALLALLQKPPRSGTKAAKLSARSSAAQPR